MQYTERGGRGRGGTEGGRRGEGEGREREREGVRVGGEEGESINISQ